VRLDTETADKLALAIGERLTACRLEQNLRQQEVAAATGISRSQLSRYEAGLTLPTILNLIKLTQFYCVAVDKVAVGAEEIQFNNLELRKRVADLEAKGGAYIRLLLEYIDGLIFDEGPKGGKKGS
jgi:transcriptional regulator with XRE-family HTH domain